MSVDEAQAVTGPLGERLRTLQLASSTTHWTEDDVMLYALGVGAGSSDPTLELHLTTENSEGIHLQVVPTFGITLCNNGPAAFLTLGIEGHEVLLLDETISLDRPIPARGSATVVPQVVDVEDHRQGYVVTIENRVTTGGGASLFTTRSATLIRRPRTDLAPKMATTRPGRDGQGLGDPDAVVTFSIAGNQCLLYRLSSGRNPLHSDPIVSRRVGYKVPLLHGRCTLGFAARHIIMHRCSGNPERLRSLSARLSAPVFPGDRLEMRIWGETRGQYEIHRPSDSTAVIRRGTYECRP